MPDNLYLPFPVFVVLKLRLAFNQFRPLFSRHTTKYWITLYYPPTLHRHDRGETKHRHTVCANVLLITLTIASWQLLYKCLLLSMSGFCWTDWAKDEARTGLRATCTFQPEVISRLERLSCALNVEWRTYFADLQLEQIHTFGRSSFPTPQVGRHNQLSLVLILFPWLFRRIDSEDFEDVAQPPSCTFP